MSSQTHVATSYRLQPWGRRILSVGAGFASIVVLSYATDAVLEGTGMLPYDNLNVAWPLIVGVILYRLVYSVLGCYIAARLAPDWPTRHALALGGSGLVLSVLGTVVTWDIHLGPAWYSLTLVTFSLPGAWLGGRLGARSRS
jgi:hypothetical protein